RFTIKRTPIGHLKNMNVLHKFKVECAELTRTAISSTFQDWADKEIRLVAPSNANFGELSTSIAHEIARQQGQSPDQIATKICSAIKVEKGSMIASVQHISGYVNFKLNYGLASKLILDSVIAQNEEYGLVKTDNPNLVTVEHTSANPSGPLTMGHARNTILGDALARILVARGHKVKTRFYVDDVGRQVSILAYGFRLMKMQKPIGKPDVWLGRLYACTNCAVQLESLKK